MTSYLQVLMPDLILTVVCLHTVTINICTSPNFALILFLLTLIKFAFRINGMENLMVFQSNYISVILEICWLFLMSAVSSNMQYCGKVSRVNLCHSPISHGLLLVTDVDILLLRSNWCTDSVLSGLHQSL